MASRVFTLLFQLTFRRLPAQHFHLADHILILEKGSIKEQGSWDKLETKQTQIEKIIGKNDNNTGGSLDQASTPLGKDTKVQPTTQYKANLLRTDGDNALYGTSIRISCSEPTNMGRILPQVYRLW